MTKLDHLRIVVESMGLNPDEVLSKDILAKPHRTVIDPENRKTDLLNEALKHANPKGVQESMTERYVQLQSNVSPREIIFT